MEPGTALFLFWLSLWLIGMVTCCVDRREEKYERDYRDCVMPWEGGPSRRERR